MLARVFTLKFSPVLDGFADEELAAFVRDRDVVDIRDHFFERDGQPYLAVFVTYRARRPETEEGAGGRSGKLNFRSSAGGIPLPNGCCPLPRSFRSGCGSR